MTHVTYGEEIFKEILNAHAVNVSRVCLIAGPPLNMTALQVPPDPPTRVFVQIRKHESGIST
jgi:hypothetical protein